MEDTKQNLALSFMQAHPLIVARSLEKQPAKAVAEFLSLAEPKDAATILELMLPMIAVNIIKLMAEDFSAHLLSAFSTNVVLSFLRAVPKKERSTIMNLLPFNKSAALELRLSYNEDTVGAAMLTDIATIPADYSAGDALDYLAQNQFSVLGEQLPVVDRKKILVGQISLCSLLNSDKEVVVEHIMEKRPKTLSARQALAAIQNHPAWAEYNILPVVDRQRQLLGMLRHADAYMVAGDAVAQRQESGEHSLRLSIFSVYANVMYETYKTMFDYNDNN